MNLLFVLTHFKFQLRRATYAESCSFPFFVTKYLRFFPEILKEFLNYFGFAFCDLCSLTSGDLPTIRFSDSYFPENGVFSTIFLAVRRRLYFPVHTMFVPISKFLNSISYQFLKNCTKSSGRCTVFTAFPTLYWNPGNVTSILPGCSSARGSKMEIPPPFPKNKKELRAGVPLISHL